MPHPRPTAGAPARSRQAGALPTQPHFLPKCPRISPTRRQPPALSFRPGPLAAQGAGVGAPQLLTEAPHASSRSAAARVTRHPDPARRSAERSRSGGECRQVRQQAPERDQNSIPGPHPGSQAASGWTPPPPLPGGGTTLRLQLRSLAGNRSPSPWDFPLNQPRAALY